MIFLASLRARWTSLLGAFVAVALGVGLIASMGLGLDASLRAPVREPERFAASDVVVMGRDTLTVPVRRGSGVGHVSKPLAHPHPVDTGLLRELRRLGPLRFDGRERDAVGVDAPARDVRAVVDGRARVLTGADRRLADPGAARDAEALVAVNAFLGTAGGVTAFVSVFVTASTFAFVVALRRREFGLLRMAGATPGQVRRQLIGEALTVGVAASAAGCALGARGGSLLADALVGAEVAPPWFAVTGASAALTSGAWLTWPFQLAFWTGLLVALAGAWAAARRAGRVPAAEAMRDASVDSGVMPWSRRIVGAALLACGLGLLLHTLATDPSALLKRKTYTTQPMLLVTAAAAFAPLLVRPVVRAFRLPGAVGLLVRENSAASVRRTAAVAAPVLVTVALAGSLLGSAQTVSGAKAAEAREQVAFDLVAAGDGLRPLDRREVPGAAAVSASAATAVFVREEGSALVRSDARAVRDPAALAATSRLPVVAGDVRDLDDRSIVVNEEWEKRRVGEHVDVWLGDGRRARLRVAAVLARGTGDNGAYVTSANAPAAGVDRVDVRLAAGADAPRAAAALARAGGEVRTAERWLAENHPHIEARTRLGLLMLLGISLLYTAISLASTLLMAGSVRDAELRSLRLAGATRRQVRLVLAGEALVAVAAGALLGLAVTAVGLAGLAAGLASLSAPVGVAVPWAEVGVCVGGCAVVAVGAALARRRA
ncbi:ABC transporter permease [Streptomyces alfalfae]|uniref:ABC transporter permease n=1 Tax=Streptomyces alfalfae TaxID=1642299 RepID=UPI001BACFC32|nr:ABC transporter permease [Streptomyces alfalfae]QUI35978.1 ABC transporter permease [Streptomyces alfalfae]